MGWARRDNAKAIKRKAKVARDVALGAGQCYGFTKVALRRPIARLLVLIWAWIGRDLLPRRNNETLNITFDVVSVKCFTVPLTFSAWRGPRRSKKRKKIINLLMIVIMASWPVKFLFSTLPRLLVLPTTTVFQPDRFVLRSYRTAIRKPAIKNDFLCSFIRARQLIIIGWHVSYSFTFLWMVIVNAECIYR